MLQKQNKMPSDSTTKTKFIMCCNTINFYIHTSSPPDGDKPFA